MIRKYLNWRPSLPVSSMADIQGYNPWDSFPGKQYLDRNDLPAISEAISEAEEGYLVRELGLIEAIIKAGGGVRRMDQARGVDEVA